MNSDWLRYDAPAALANHLWQSTLFALVIAVLVLVLRRNSARVRHALWLVASLKFLVPFALLALLGAYLPWHPGSGAAVATAPPVLAAAGKFIAPLAPVEDHWRLLTPQFGGSSSMRTGYTVILPMLALLWAAAALVVAGRCWFRWRALRRTLRKSSTGTGVEFPAAVHVTSEALEPGIVGIFKPVLLLPAGIEQRLTPEQLRTVLAHERCHLRRRDNFTAALHMLVETLFWFHPLVWWIGARLIDERERACDEQVVREGHAPQSYAEAILSVCEHYIAARLPCVSGVSGSDLRKRVESIMKNPFIARLNASKKFVLGTLTCLAVATPLAAGVAAWHSIQGRSLYRSADAQYWALLDAAEGDFTACARPKALLLRRQARMAATVVGLRAGDGDRVLLYAVMANSPADTRRLLADGAAHRGDGFLLPDSLMHVAAQFGDPALLQVLLDAGIGVNGMASDLGAGPDASFARNPLMVAIAAGRKDNAEWLIRHGADVNATNAGGSPLGFAIALCRDQQLTTELLQAGAGLTARIRQMAATQKIDLSQR